MVDVEQVLNLVEQNERIPEIENPIKADIKKATIEFKDVEFTYDIKLPKEEQRSILNKISFKVEAG